MIEKNLYRKKYQLLRKQLSSQKKKNSNINISEQLMEMLKTLFQKEDSFILHTYINNPKWIEVDTSLIIKKIKDFFPKCTICIPHIIDDKKMESVHIDTYNIIPAKDIHIMLIPLLISDREGCRIGYGKGYYDRYLKRCHKDIITIGLNWFPPTKERLPKNNNDIAIQSIIYPKSS